jgi:HEPN domain-containing protein
MIDLDGARRLLGMARKDLQALQGMTDSATFADEIFGFHAQQSMEKSLKAWLAVRGVEYPKTHDLRALLALLTEHGIDVQDLWDLVEYNLFAVQFRYEAFDLFEEVLDREAVIRRVVALVQRVERVVGEAEGLE